MSLSTVLLASQSTPIDIQTTIIITANVYFWQFFNYSIDQTNFILRYYSLPIHLTLFNVLLNISIVSKKSCMCKKIFLFILFSCFVGTLLKKMQHVKSIEYPEKTEPDNGAIALKIFNTQSVIRKKYEEARMDRLEREHEAARTIKPVIVSTSRLSNESASKRINFSLPIQLKQSISVQTKHLHAEPMRQLCW